MGGQEGQQEAPFWLGPHPPPFVRPVTVETRYCERRHSTPDTASPRPYDLSFYPAKWAWHNWALKHHRHHPPIKSDRSQSSETCVIDSQSNQAWWENIGVFRGNWGLREEPLCPQSTWISAFHSWPKGGDPLMVRALNNYSLEMVLPFLSRMCCSVIFLKSFVKICLTFLLSCKVFITAEESEEVGCMLLVWL